MSSTEELVTQMNTKIKDIANLYSRKIIKLKQKECKQIVADDPSIIDINNYKTHLTKIKWKQMMDNRKIEKQKRKKKKVNTGIEVDNIIDLNV